MKSIVKNAYFTAFKIVKRFEESPFVRLGAIFAILLVPYQFYLDRSARIEDGIARSWEILATASPGNSGKIAALEYLARQGQSLSGIDLSCAAMSGKRSEEFGAQAECFPLTYLVGLDLSHENIRRKVDMSNANLSGANLLGANLDSVDLRFSKFDNSELGGVNFDRANLGGSSFVDSSFGLTDEPPSFRATHVSRANFLNTHRNIQYLDFGESFITNGGIQNYLGRGGPGFQCRLEDWITFDPLGPPYPSKENSLFIMKERCVKLR